MRVARAEWSDWYVDGDESAVLIDSNVMVLSALATWILMHVDGDTPVSELADVLVGEFGEPEDGDALGATESAVRELTQSGVLVEVGR